MKIVFFGTTDFAVASLDKLLQSNHEVAAVVTAENKFGGRGRKELIKSAVCVFSEAHSLNLLQPKSLKGPRFLGKLNVLNADLFVVVAFRMMPQVLWSMPKHGTVNLHGSLLPAYRGAAPINWAIIRGEKMSGASIFFLDQKIDTGKIIYAVEAEIGPEENFGDYYNKLKIKGANALVEAVTKIENNDFIALAQDESNASHAPKLDKENTKIDFTKSAAEVVNLCRGLDPYPGAWCSFEGNNLKIYKCEEIESDLNSEKWESDFKNYLNIGCNGGAVSVIELQPEGKKRMSIKEYLNGAGQKLKALKGN